MGDGDDNTNNYKSIYVTIYPEEYDTGTCTALDRVRRAVGRSRSCDLTLPKDVPWQDVFGKQRSDRFLEKLASSNSKSNAAGDTTKKTMLKKKKIKEKDPNEQLKLEFYKLLNIRDPADGCSGFNVSKTNKLMDELPSLATDKYLLTAFAEPITALHMLCAIDAPLRCIKRCFQHNPDAIHDNSSAIGSPLHYACWFRASAKAVRYIASNVDDPVAVLTLPNRAKRTPLHLACMSAANATLVEFLTLACPAAAAMTDKDGMTPLHHALTVEEPVLAVIEDLTEVCPEAVCVKAAITGSTPLHLALSNRTYADESVATDILKDLVASNPRALRLSDAVAGNLPLHAAVAAGRRLRDVKLLLKKYPHAAALENASGETPYKMAKKAHKADKDVLKLLKPMAVL